jgi:hypothetical protein
MRISISKKETSYDIEYSENELCSPDEMQDLCDVVAGSLSKPQCCTDCADNDYEKGKCPCRSVMSLL